MKRLIIREHGGPEVMQQEEVAIPTPGAGEVLVQLEAIGLNFIDTYQRSGLYKMPLPFTPGNEAAGVVAAVGSGVSQFKAGDKVAYTGVIGAYGDYAIAPATKLILLPANMDTRIAASLMLQGMTAHYLCRTTYPIEAKASCLIHAGAGGVGLLLIQMCKMQGALVLTTVSTPEKAKLAKEAGADHVILYTQEDFAQSTAAFLGERKLDVIYDSVAKDTFDKGLTLLRPRGTMVLFGQSSGPVAPFDLNRLNLAGSLYVTRPSLAHHTLTREELEYRAGEVFGWAASGKLKVRIGAEFPLAQAQEAHRALEGRKTTGKVLLIP